MEVGWSEKRRAPGEHRHLSSRFIRAGVWGFTLLITQVVAGGTGGTKRSAPAQRRRGWSGLDSAPSGSCNPQPTSSHVPGLPGLPSNERAAGAPGARSSRVSPSGGGSGPAGCPRHVDSPERAAQGAWPTVPGGRGGGGARARRSGRAGPAAGPGVSARRGTVAGKAQTGVLRDRVGACQGERTRGREA